MPLIHKIEKIPQQWTLGDIVDKQTLRPEVQDFCGQFPVYRLEPYTPDSVFVVAEDKGYTHVGKPACVLNCVRHIRALTVWSMSLF